MRVKAAIRLPTGRLLVITGPASEMQDVLKAVQFQLADEPEGIILPPPYTGEVDDKPLLSGYRAKTVKP